MDLVLANCTCFISAGHGLRLGSCDKLFQKIFLSMPGQGFDPVPTEILISTPSRHLTNPAASQLFLAVSTNNTVSSPDLSSLAWLIHRFSVV